MSWSILSQQLIKEETNKRLFPWSGGLRPIRTPDTDSDKKKFPRGLPCMNNFLTSRSHKYLILIIIWVGISSKFQIPVLFDVDFHQPRNPEAFPIILTTHISLKMITMFTLISTLSTLTPQGLVASSRMFSIKWQIISLSDRISARVWKDWNYFHVHKNCISLPDICITDKILGKIAQIVYSR